MVTFSALANPNIAFIKYWGNFDNFKNLPLNGSISMNLEGLETLTTVLFDLNLHADNIVINTRLSTGEASMRVTKLLDAVRTLAGISSFAWVDSSNNFPSGAGIASSASAFASLAMAASAAAGLNLCEASLSRLARLGSGSACRSIPGGFVEWVAGTGDADSFASSIAPQNYWDLVDCIAMISTKQKSIGSTQGHKLARTSPYQSARVTDSSRRLDTCRQAILKRDFSSFAEIVEQDSNMMHAVMMTSNPPLFYWQPPTLEVMQTLREARAKGMPVCYTIDAGPNVHVICTGDVVNEVTKLVGDISGVREVCHASAGGPTRLVDTPTEIKMRFKL
jgi:diphosphomevalonate decarboxylase